jgi:phosphoglycolate phosphatase-like HAD superfamily hydrolase
VKDWAIIFDVDGVLLELTRAEEELFFQPFASHIDSSKLSRDWNSYKIRNDEDIVKEIVARYHLPASEAHVITDEYMALLEQELNDGLKSVPIEGAEALLKHVSPLARLGVATANFRMAAKMRLQQAGMWGPVSALAFGADGGGHKSVILARVIAACGLPHSRIIFVGDNVNDVQAGIQNKVHFIGFSADSSRREKLAAAGAQRLAANHTETLQGIVHILGA